MSGEHPRNTYYRRASWPCNEVGILVADGKLRDNTHAAQAFGYVCTFGLQAGCDNRAALAAGQQLRHASPLYRDYAVLLRTGKAPRPPQPPVETFENACAQSWAGGCESLGTQYLNGEGVSRDRAKAREYLQRSCQLGWTSACDSLASIEKEME